MVKDVAKYRENLLIKKDVDDHSSTDLLLQKLEAIEGKQTKEEEKAPVEQKKWKNLNNLVKKLGGLVIQKYEERPLLINKKKFDLRFFMLIACTKPYLVMTNPGYLRLSLEDYNTDVFEGNDKITKATHLTNASVQKSHPKFKEMKEDTIWSVEKFQEYLTEHRPEAGSDSAAKIVNKCNEICRLLFESVKDKLERKFGCFELFGLDFLVNDDLNPVLIEINTNPALFTDT